MCVEHNGYTIHYGMMTPPPGSDVKPGYYFTIEVPGMIPEYCGPFITDEACIAYAKDVVDNHLDLFLAVPASWHNH